MNLTARDLADGNYFFHKSKIAQLQNGQLVNAQTGRVISFAMTKQLKPIPLTPEILKKCGFKPFAEHFPTQQSRF